MAAGFFFGRDLTVTDLSGSMMLDLSFFWEELEATADLSLMSGEVENRMKLLYRAAFCFCQSRELMASALREFRRTRLVVEFGILEIELALPKDRLIELSDELLLLSLRPNGVPPKTLRVPNLVTEPFLINEFLFPVPLLKKFD